jgi:hypothetical protein
LGAAASGAVARRVLRLAVEVVLRVAVSFGLGFGFRVVVLGDAVAVRLVVGDDVADVLATLSLEAEDSGAAWSAPPQAVRSREAAPPTAASRAAYRRG